MVTGVGTDIVEIERIEKAIQRKGFVKKIFTEAEQAYCREAANSMERFAGRFAAKEAVSKSLGGGLSWADVEILPDASGKPEVKLANKAARLVGKGRVLVSISHCRTYAVAYAVAVSD